MAPVVLEARRRGRFRVLLCATGQHKDMLYHGLEPFELTPDIDLGLMQYDQTLHGLTSRLLTSITDCLTERTPDAVLVQGDTQSCLAGALASFWKRIPLGHVEAGLRTAYRTNPFPEEMNRRLTDQLADWHFAPTQQARENLLREGIPLERTLVTGNTAIDALFIGLAALQKTPPAYTDFDPRILEGHSLILVTEHRRENHGPNLELLCQALCDVVQADESLCIVFPVHMNPHVQRAVQKELASVDRIHLIAPQPYLPFIDLMQRARVIVTDSGGIQEEAPSLGKAVLVTRVSTERPEVLSTGLVRLIESSRDAIRKEILRSLSDSQHIGPVNNPCGDGRAAERILDFLERQLL